MKRSKKYISSFLLSAVMVFLCVPSFIANASQSKDGLAVEVKENANLEDALTIVDTNDVENFGAMKKDTPTEIPTVKGGRGHTGGSGEPRTPDENGYFAPPTANAGPNEVFGGWYKDEKRTQPYEKDSLDAEGGFARWVSADVMSVKVQITADTTASSASTDMRIVSTVDTLMYRNAGFFITIGSKTTRISCRTVYTKLVGVDGSVVFNYSPSEFCTSSKYFTTFTLKNIPNANFKTEIKVTPYWMTMDATMVKGTEVIKTVNGCL